MLNLIIPCRLLQGMIKFEWPAQGARKRPATPGRGTFRVADVQSASPSQFQSSNPSNFLPRSVNTAGS